MARVREFRNVVDPVKSLPVLAIRDQVHFPGLVNTVHVRRERSLASATRALASDRLLLVVSQRDMGLDEPGPHDLAEIGTISEILHHSKMADGGLRLVLRGLYRARPLLLHLEDGAFEALPEPLNDRRVRRDERAEVVLRSVLERFGRLANVHAGIPNEAIQSVAHLERPGELADAVAHFVPLRPNEKQAILEDLDPLRRLDRIHDILAREERLVELQESIRNQVDQEVGDAQRQFYLREQMRIIRRELHEPDEHDAEIDEYRERIAEIALPDPVARKVEQELRRLERQSPGSPEAAQIRGYLDLLLDLPWGKLTEDRADLAEAERILDEEHFGLTDVKERILEFLAVRVLRKEPMGGALCFVGPPGVGKTGFARALSAAIGRKMVRIALGGVRDESEIRGHRRTYVGAMPGRLAQGLRTAGSMNPVVVLDEIDKMAMEMRGDPAAALLEALDFGQNAAFQDHYLEVPLDLSQVLFVATANVWEALPMPLRDRLEYIPFEGYTDRERLEIARRYLAPRAASAHGLSNPEIFGEGELERLVKDKIREPGLRGLDREIASVCRRLARRELTGHAAVSAEVPPLVVTREDAIGVAWGVAVGSQGGTPLRIEAVALPVRGTQPGFEVTGNLGVVMQESAQTAFSVVRGLVEGNFVRDLHVHVPAGAVPKDGPSAGLALVAALASAVSGKTIASDVASTGEITLTGHVLPVGGAREKLMAASREGFRILVLPEGNRLEVEAMASDVREGIDVHFVKTVADALPHLIPGLSHA